MRFPELDPEPELDTEPELAPEILAPISAFVLPGGRRLFISSNCTAQNEYATRSNTTLAAASDVVVVVDVDDVVGDAGRRNSCRFPLIFNKIYDMSIHI